MGLDFDGTHMWITKVGLVFDGTHMKVTKVGPVFDGTHMKVTKVGLVFNGLMCESQKWVLSLMDSCVNHKSGPCL